MTIIITCLPLPSYAGFKFKINQQNQESQSSNSSQQENSHTANQSNQNEGNFAIGDEYVGGIIFYIDDSGKHGLVASDTDIRGTRSWDEAMKACRNYKKNGNSDWFLPNMEQLAELYLRRSVVGGWVPKSAYWSSSESDIPGCAWLQYFSTGAQYRNFGKNYLHYVRCVRAF
jgi:hypothetical protein